MNIDSLTVASVVVSSLCAVLYIGLGFLSRPSRTSAIWALGFIGYMAANYFAAFADSAGSLPMRGFSSGLMTGTIGLIWVGLRVGHRRQGWTWVPVLAFLAVAPTLLYVAADTELYLTALRIVFAAAGVFPLLSLLELLKLKPIVRREVLPLALGCAVYIVLGVLALVQEVLRVTSGHLSAGALSEFRELITIGAIVFAILALTTLLLLTRSVRTDRTPTDQAAAFIAVARDRLGRAEAVGDRWWSLIVVRLDDPDALRDAATSSAFDGIVDAFGSVVRRSLPAEADLDRRSDSEYAVLLPRPEGAVRRVLTELLAEVAKLPTDISISVRMSSSVGWAPVDAVGYDLDALTTAARAAADRAAAAGGDRWERVAGVE